METDQVYGHRHDVEGFHRALREIDAAVGEWLGLLRDDDLLVLTADHGVDPRAPHTDHTREHAPLLATFAGQDGHRHDGPLADVGASTLKWLAGREARSFRARPSLSAAAPRTLSAVPELPEVETIRRQLAPLVEGRVVARLEIADPRWCLPLAPEAIVDAVQGRAVRAARRGAASTSCGSSRTRPSCSCTCA